MVQFSGRETPRISLLMSNVEKPKILFGCQVYSCVTSLDILKQYAENNNIFSLLTHKQKCYIKKNLNDARNAPE